MKRTCITTFNKALVKEIFDAKIIGFDTETVSLTDKTMVGFSFAFGSKSYYVPIRDHVLPNMPMDEAKELLKIVVGSCTIVLHNSLFSFTILINNSL